MNRDNRTSRREFLRRSGGAIVGAGLLLPGAGLLAGVLRDHRLHSVEHATFVMGQVASVTLLVADRDTGHRVVTEIFAEYRRLEAMMSLYQETSGLSAINREAGKDSVVVAHELRDVIVRSMEVARRSNGAFDITVEPLLRLWGFRDIHPSHRPTDKAIHEALDAVGIGNVHVEGDRVGLAKSNGSLDLGGVAVGYALDRAADIVRRADVASALLEISGDYFAVGHPPESAKGWSIGLQDPRVEGGVWKTLSIRDQSLTTSGNYASTVAYDAKQYGHIFDPAEGFPAEGLLSATVVAPSGFEADSYSTAIFVAGDRSILPPKSTAALLRS